MPANDVAPGFAQTLAGWKQGDAVVEAGLLFFHLADLSCPLTAASREEACIQPPEPSDPLAAVASSPQGLVVVTQTCDIVRNWDKRPYVEVSPLVRVDPHTLEEIRKARRPQYAYLPGLADKGLVADLDQTMTIEKAVLAPMTPVRVAGCVTDQDRREFSQALARKRQRPAFPNDFNSAATKLTGRIKEKHNKGTPEGEFARALSEIRVRAAPSWDAQEVRLTFYLILDRDLASECEGSPYALIRPNEQDYEQAKSWIVLFAANKKFVLDKDEPWRLCFLADLSAEEYVYSDRLDLDDLSAG
ncbi:hypothetical protein G3576_26280 [Roseomonas stagni]|uniref:Uncharacterized protein n=1 Tax=Falsiroseomonas algicola TaxID=2716930 RepID=A0A6M1LSS4_9PROT|nr:hypothetical protein [Falsiroseomonas algicola]NGM23548.1 hypothetical protein [Falsiroseomonas algicola]